MTVFSIFCTNALSNFVKSMEKWSLRDCMFQRVEAGECWRKTSGRPQLSPHQQRCELGCTYSDLFFVNLKGRAAEGEGWGEMERGKVGKKDRARELFHPLIHCQNALVAASLCIVPIPGPLPHGRQQPMCWCQLLLLFPRRFCREMDQK